MGTAAAILSKYDVSRSSVLESSEFAALTSDIMRFQQSTKAQTLPMDEVTRIFRAADRDNSNSIEHGELLSALNQLGLPTNYDSGRVLSRYDTNHDGSSTSMSSARS